MPRRRCCGLVEQEPSHRRFSPEDARDAMTVTLRVEELEAVRLKDLAGMDQAACAMKMGVSRASFQRILAAARKKIASALVEGNSIIINGGTYMVKNRKFECQECAHVWEVAPCSEGGKHGYEIACPKCGSMKKIKINEDGQKQACGGGQHHDHEHRSDHSGGCCGH